MERTMWARWLHDVAARCGSLFVRIMRFELYAHELDNTEISAVRFGCMFAWYGKFLKRRWSPAGYEKTLSLQKPEPWVRDTKKIYKLYTYVHTHAEIKSMLCRETKRPRGWGTQRLNKEHDLHSLHWTVLPVYNYRDSSLACLQYIHLFICSSSYVSRLCIVIEWSKKAVLFLLVYCCERTLNMFTNTYLSILNHMHLFMSCSWCIQYGKRGI